MVYFKSIRANSKNGRPSGLPYSLRNAEVYLPDLAGAEVLAPSSTECVPEVRW
jgi:hypothetical protein